MPKRPEIEEPELTDEADSIIERLGTIAALLCTGKLRTLTVVATADLRVSQSDITATHFMACRSADLLPEARSTAARAAHYAMQHTEEVEVLIYGQEIEREEAATPQASAAGAVGGPGRRGDGDDVAAFRSALGVEGHPLRWGVLNVRHKPN